MAGLSVMNGLLLYGIGDLRLEKIAKPTLRPGHVLIKIAACGVCGSDLPRIFVKGTYTFPIVCGHEFSGIIESCGEGVKHFKPGQRVAVFPLIWCGQCSACEKGHYVQCDHYDYLGSRSNGGFAEFVVAPEQNLIALDETINLDEAAMIEPAAVALHAVKKVRQHVGGGDVVVLGAGPIGLMTAQWARIIGAGRVLIFDIVDKKLELAKNLGFQYVYNSAKADPVSLIMDLTKQAGADICIEAAGVPVTFNQALSACKRNGYMVILGNPSGDVTLPVSLISQVMRREIQIYGCWNSEYAFYGVEDDWHAVVKTLAEKKMLLSPLISHRIKLSDSIDVLAKMKNNEEFFCKVIIYP